MAVLSTKSISFCGGGCGRRVILESKNVATTFDEVKNTDPSLEKKSFIASMNTIHCIKSSLFFNGQFSYNDIDVQSFNLMYPCDVRFQGT